MELLLILAVVAGAAIWLSSRNNKKRDAEIEQRKAADARADAQRWTERLSHQVLTLSGTDQASTQALADASDRYNAANSALSTAQSAREFQLARESALEGLHYVNAAREIMGMPAGPELPELEGQKKAGKVTERRTITHEGQEITVSPEASEDAPHYYPGGNVAGRPVPAGWYSTPWWAPAMASGMWTMSSVMMFSMMFSGMAGAPSAAAFEAGYDEGLADAGGDVGDAGDAGNAGDGDMGDMGDGGGFFGGDGGDGGLFGGDGGGIFDFGFE
ncbi:hypothetical protein C3B44_09220 [Corynebacterium yudongzhengii]|uniref:DUF1542 domain-containing protein n=1 Tax=Corynebacterium yudongzhengii TaxID=2080740 RepID=A0A2U1T8V2_9CORY|nr:hypothetical protein [Corynebacterium yudongzhengii]AWB82507.1 hypothetical protein C3B44_09220 [Corynebacterium yudongzhengii]PWC02437.1 hypothetical protein DF222_02050 [Corynebacterium yudongzhengii]